jgi:hypothetical protein
MMSSCTSVAVDELDDRGVPDVLVALVLVVVEQPRRQQEQCGPDAFAAALREVAAHAVDRGDRRAEVEEELLLDLRELLGDQVVRAQQAEGGAHRISGSAVIGELQRDAEVAAPEHGHDLLEVVLGPADDAHLVRLDRRLDLELAVLDRLDDLLGLLDRDALLILTTCRTVLPPAGSTFWKSSDFTRSRA